MTGRILAKNIGWQGLAIAIFILGELLVTLLLSMGFGKQGFGLYAFAFAYAFIGFQAVDMRIADAVIAFYPALERDGAPAAHALAAFAVALDALRAFAGLAALALSAPLLVPHLWKEAPAVAEVLLMATFLFLNNMLIGSTRGYLRVTGAFRRQAMLQAAASMAKVAAAGLAVWSGARDIRAVLEWMCAAGGLFLLANIWLLAGHARARGFTLSLARRGLPLLPRRKLLVFMWHNYIAGLSGIVTKELDILVLSSMTGAAAVGVYRLAKSFAGGLGALWDALFFVLFPEISRLLAAADHDRLRRLIRLNITGGLAASALMLAGGTAAVWLFIRWFYAGLGYDQAPVLFAILAARYLVWAPMMWLNPLVLSLGQAHLSAIAAWMAAAAAAAMLWVFTGLWAAPGAAAANALSSAALLLPLYLLASRKGLLKQAFKDQAPRKAG